MSNVRGKVWVFVETEVQNASLKNVSLKANLQKELKISQRFF